MMRMIERKRRLRIYPVRCHGRARRCRCIIFHASQFRGQHTCTGSVGVHANLKVVTRPIATAAYTYRRGLDPQQRQMSAREVDGNKMARTFSAVVAATAVACASAVPDPVKSNYSVCVLYVNATAQQFAYGVIGDAGSLHQLVSLPELVIVSNGIAAGAEEGVFYTYAADGQQTTTLLEVNLNNDTQQWLNIGQVSGGYTGNFYTSELNNDWANNGLVGILNGIVGPNDDPTWYAIADINVKLGTAKPLLNLTEAEESFKWVKIGCTAFDDISRTFWMIAGVGADETETLIGYDASGSSSGRTPVYVTVPSSIDIIALQYSQALGSPVALAYNRTGPGSLFAWFAVEPSSTPASSSSAARVVADAAWRTIFEYPLNSVYLGGMGEADIMGNGTVVAASFEVPVTEKEARSVISAVNISSGLELYRRNVTKHMDVADVQFCNVKP